MKTAQQIVSYIAESIGSMYHHRPLMYGGSEEGVDLLLWTYHQIYAEVVERQEDLQSVRREVLDEEECQAASFPTRYLWDHPNATQEDIADYVTKQWRKVSDRLGVPIPHDRLKLEFDEFKAGIRSRAP